MKLPFELRVKGDNRNLFLIFIVVLILPLLTIHVLRVKPRFRQDISIFKPSNMASLSSYEAKMRRKLGWRTLDYYEFIKKNTPDDAKILIPPPATFPWPVTGNAAYSRYFLYPRHLINGKEKEPGVNLKKENIGYVFLAWGESEDLTLGYSHGWPKFSLPAKKIIYRKTTEEVYNYDKIISEKDFDPTEKQTHVWGLIEVDLERL